MGSLMILDRRRNSPVDCFAAGATAIDEDERRRLHEKVISTRQECSLLDNLWRKCPLDTFVLSGKKQERSSVIDGLFAFLQIANKLRKVYAYA
jgi:hypothetical protein